MLAGRLGLVGVGGEIPVVGTSRSGGPRGSVLVWSLSWLLLLLSLVLLVAVVVVVVVVVAAAAAAVVAAVVAAVAAAVVVGGAWASGAFAERC